MRKHPLRKFLELTVIYSVVIIGIFVLQFKAESVISIAINDMKISLAQTQTSNGQTKLKNQIRISFNGIAFFYDDKNPIIMVYEDGKEKKLTLDSYEKLNDTEILFAFTNNCKLKFTATKDNNDSPELLISVLSSEKFKEMLLPYKISQTYNIEKLNPSSLLLSSKKAEFTFIASRFDSDKISFSCNDSFAKFSPYVTTKEFVFESVAGLEGTTEEEFNRLSKKLRTSFVAKMTSMFKTAEADSLSELEIAAYIAERASYGDYNIAIDSVPQSFKKSNKRTYFTAPFFNNLISMNKSLIIQTEKYASLVSSKNPDVFTVSGISDYILREKMTRPVIALLSVPSETENFNPTPIQAGGIIDVYADIYKKDKNLAAYLEGCIDTCIDKIKKACCLDSGELILAVDTEDNPIVINKEQAVEIGNALVKIGKCKNNPAYEQAGYLIMYTYLKDQNADIHVISNIYKILAKDNFFYPHTELLGYYGTHPVWAWTSARTITYTFSSGTVGDIYIDFPKNLSHYLIFTGIPSFNGKIQIQNLNFRSDPRFEIYNSSGYAYRDNISSLFLKSRHKAKIEHVKLFFPVQKQFTTTADMAKAKEMADEAEETRRLNEANAAAEKKESETKTDADKNETAVKPEQKTESATATVPTENAQ